MSTSINISTIPYCSRVLRLGPPRLERDLRCHSITTSTVSNCKQLRIYKEMRYCIIYDAEMELMNLILLSIPNDIYNSVDACTSAKDMWKRVEHGSNAPNEDWEMFKGLIRTASSGNTSTVQCYNCSGKGHYARNCPKPRVRDSKYFMEQMLLAKQDEARVILTDEQNDFLFADASRMEEIEELSANICLMDKIQPVDNTSDDGPSYDSIFISSIEKDTHVPDLCALEQLARNAYQEAECDNRDLSRILELL
ncbi:retrovirus-related pol polyprotein from transposon TNT 1-94 [Tanacetum coccineum]